MHIPVFIGQIAKSCIELLEKTIDLVVYLSGCTAVFGYFDCTDVTIF